MDVLGKVRATIQKYGMIADGERVVVGVSGGPDSVTLLHCLWRLRDERRMELHVAHVNHMLRGEASDEDEKYVRELGRRLGVAVRVERVDVGAVAREKHLSREEAGREARYGFFFRLATEVGAAKIAVGQHADDQAETVLMRLVRGSGIDGLAGIPPVREGRVVRPLIEVTRGEIERYCREHKLQPRTDASNLEPEFARNKVRLVLLPLLEAEFNPRIRETLARTASVLREEAQFLAQCGAAAAARMARRDEGRVEIELRELASLHPAMRRRVVREAIRLCGGETGRLQAVHIDGVTKLLEEGGVGARLSLPGGIGVRRTYGSLVISSSPARAGGPPSFERVLNIPGETPVEELGLVVEARVIDEGVRADAARNAVAFEGYFDYNRLRTPLVVRTRRRGDKFQPLGMSGTKSLKEFFIDLKVPREERDFVGIVCDAEGEVVWVVGLRVDDRWKVTDATRRVLHLRAEPFEAD